MTTISREKNKFAVTLYDKKKKHTAPDSRKVKSQVAIGFFLIDKKHYFCSIYSAHYSTTTTKCIEFMERCVRYWRSFGYP